MKKQQFLARLVVVLLVCGFSPFVFGQAEIDGTLTIVNQYGGGGVYFLTIERGSGGGPVRAGASSPAEPAKLPEKTTTTEHGRGGAPIPVRVSSRTEPVKRLEEPNTIERGNGGSPFRLAEGKMYGSNVLIADGSSKSYSLKPGSYYVTLNFYKPGKGVYTMTDPPIVITAGQTRTLTITADGKLKY